jgi:hypothetical protein
MAAKKETGHGHGVAATADQRYLACALTLIAFAKVVRAFVEHQLIIKHSAANHASGPSSAHAVAAAPRPVKHSDQLAAAVQVQLSL